MWKRKIPSSVAKDWLKYLTTCMECRTHTKTPALFSILNLRNIVFRKYFASCTWDAHVEKRTKTTKFQMSNHCLGVNQLLGVAPNRNQQTFFFIFLHEPYISLLYEWWKWYFFMLFKCFSSFLTMRTHGQACVFWLKYTTLKSKLSFIVSTKHWKSFSWVFKRGLTFFRL